MGIIQKDALRTTLISYFGLIFGYLNKGVLFLLFFSPEQIGLVNLLLSVGLLFGQLSNFGFINTVWRFFPFFRNESGNNFGFLIFSLKKVFLGCLVFSILLILLKNEISSFYIENSASFVHYYFWVIPIGIANVLFLILEAYLRGLHKNILPVFANEFLHRLLLTLLLFLFGFDFIPFKVFVILFSLSFFMPTFILTSYLLKLNELKIGKIKTPIPKKLRNIMYTYSTFSYMSTLGVTVVITIDAMMIASFLGLAATGIYTTVLYFISAMQIPIKSTYRISMSLVSKYWKSKDMVQMDKLYKKTSSISLIIFSYSFLLILVNSDLLISFIPKEFKIGVYTFYILMIGKWVDVYLGINGIIFTSSKKYKYDILFTVILLASVFTLNLFLIPLYAIAGAAMSTSLALIIYNVGRLLIVWKWYKLHPFEINQLYVFLLFIVILFSFQLINCLHLNRYLQIIFNTSLSSLVYFGLIIKFKWNEDLNVYLNKIVLKLFKKDLRLS